MLVLSSFFPIPSCPLMPCQNRIVCITYPPAVAVTAKVNLWNCSSSAYFFFPYSKSIMCLIRGGKILVLRAGDRLKIPKVTKLFKEGAPRRKIKHKGHTTSTSPWWLHEHPPLISPMCDRGSTSPSELLDWLAQCPIIETGLRALPSGVPLVSVLAKRGRSHK